MRLVIFPPLVGFASPVFAAEGERELRVELNQFWDRLVTDCVLTKILAEQMNSALPEAELVDTLAFFKTSAGQKFAQGPA